jgi:hypothetical protein
MRYLSPTEQYYNQFVILFDGISLFFWLIPLPFIWLYWKELNKPLKLFGAYLFTLFFWHIIEQIHIYTVLKNDFYWEIMKGLDLRDTNFLGITYRLTTLLFLNVFYQYTFDKTNSYLFLEKPIFIISCFVCISIYFYVDGYKEYGTVNSTLIRSYLIVLPTIAIYKLAKVQLNNTIWKNPIFLINMGLLVPNIFMLLMSFLGSDLHKSNFILFAQSGVIRNILSLLGELLFVMAYRNHRYQTAY